MTWSRQSRLIEPITLSTNGFCHGLRGAVTISSMPIAFYRARNSRPYAPSRSRMMYRGAVSHGKTSRICCATHAVVGCAVTPKLDAPPFVAQHDEDEQNGERGRWHHKEIGRDEAADVVVEEPPPRLRRWLPMPHHVPRYGRLRCLDSQLHEFAVDARSASQWILVTHSTDELADIFRHRRPSWFAAPGFPGPERTKSLPVPADDGFRPYAHQRLAPARPKAGKNDPEQAVERLEPRPSPFPLQNYRLLAEGEVFQV